MQKIKHLVGDAIPEVLRLISSPPQDLYVLGQLQDLLERPRLSVVGSRKPSPYGIKVTQTFIQELAGQGLVIISGLAFGVDSVAHRACLESGGQTLAVLPSSLEHIYPSNHQKLAQDIIDGGGALVSEYPSDNIAYKTNFVARNRLVSGLGDGVLIIEAADKSGTLHTANFALDQGKTVMVVPGNITSPLSAGTNKLLRVGAVPITSSQDVIQALGLKRLDRSVLAVVAANCQEAAILELMSTGITDSSHLMEQCGLPPSLFNQTVTMLEITGKILPLGAGHYRLASN